MTLDIWANFDPMPKQGKKKLPQTFRPILAANLRRAMGFRTAEQLGIETGLGKRTITRMRNASSGPAPRLDSLQAIADELKIDLWRLLAPPEEGDDLVQGSEARSDSSKKIDSQADVAVKGRKRREG